MIKISFLLDKSMKDSFDLFLSGYKNYYSDYRFIDHDSKLSFIEVCIYDCKSDLYKKVFDWINYKLSQGELV